MSASLDENRESFHIRAQSALSATRGLLTIAIGALSSRCTVAQRIDPNVLDCHQVCAYELALSEAELLAAETLLQREVVFSEPSEQDSAPIQLAMLFIAETLCSVDARFVIFVSAGLLTIEAVLRTRHAVQANSFTVDMLDPQLQARIGRGVLNSGGRVAGVRLDSELLLIQDTFARFAREQLAPAAQSIHRQNLGIPESLLEPLRRMGCFGMSVPQRYGGSAPDDSEDNLPMIVASEALSQASLGAGGSLITRPEIVTRILLVAGTEEQRLTWLPRIAAGETLCAIAITEPDFGSDVAGLQLSAKSFGQGWLLTGAKTWCTFAGRAGLLLLVARTETAAARGHEGLSVFLVEKPSFDGREFHLVQPNGGSLSGKAIDTIGYRGMHSFDLHFDDFEVPAAALVGGQAGLSNGFYATMSGLSAGRIQTAARANGLMQAALISAVEHAAVRRVFGRALADYQLTASKLARMAARLLACRVLTHAVASKLNAQTGQMEASLVKLFACRTAEWLTREAMQIHGGAGYAEESDVSRYFVDARVLSIFEGAEETLAIKVVARELLDRARSRREDGVAMDCVS